MRNPNLFDLNLLRVFDVVMRERNVSLAAARLCLTQPAVSNALSRLRIICEDPLFVRTRGGMEPTAVALALFAPIQEALSLVRSALLEGLTFDPATSDRSFTIITTDLGEVNIGGPLLANLTKNAPNVNLAIMEAAAEEYENLLDSGKVDMAIGYFSISETFRRELIGSCWYVAVICSKFAAKLNIREGEIFPLKDLRVSSHVDVVPRVAAESPVARAFATHAPSRRVALRVPHIWGLRSILPGTEFVASVPQPAVPALCKGGDLTWALLPFEQLKTELYLGWHKRHDNDRGHRWMREAVRSIRERYMDVPPADPEKKFPSLPTPPLPTPPLPTLDRRREHGGVDHDIAVRAVGRIASGNSLGAPPRGAARASGAKAV